MVTTTWVSALMAIDLFHDSTQQGENTTGEAGCLYQFERSHWGSHTRAHARYIDNVQTLHPLPLARPLDGLVPVHPFRCLDRLSGPTMACIPLRPLFIRTRKRRERR